MVDDFAELCSLLVMYFTLSDDSRHCEYCA